MIDCPDKSPNLRPFPRFLLVKDVFINDDVIFILTMFFLYCWEGIGIYFFKFMDYATGAPPNISTFLCNKRLSKMHQGISSAGAGAAAFPFECAF